MYKIDRRGGAVDRGGYLSLMIPYMKNVTKNVFKGGRVEQRRKGRAGEQKGRVGDLRTADPSCLLQRFIKLITR